MKIALFSETFLPKIDGIVTRLTGTVDALTQLGHQVLLVVPDCGRSVYGGASVLNLPWFAPPFYPESRVAFPGHRVFEALDRFGPDVIHVAGPLVLGIAGVVYARRRKLPLLASYHAHLPKYLPHMGLADLVPHLWHSLRCVHDHADVNLCTSAPLLDELAAQGFARLRVWRRAVDAQLFHPAKRSEAMRRTLSQGETEKPLLLYVGRLSAEKEIGRLRAIHARFPDVRLAIVGDGPQRGALEPMFSATPTTFTGYLRGEELAAAYASSDLFVFPSRSETLGLVLLEAMASGCPVIAAAAGGVTDVCVPGVTGALFRPGDSEDMLAAVGSLLSVSRSRLKCAGALRERCRQEAESWDWASCGRELVRYYREAIACPVHLRPQRLADTVRSARCVLGAWTRAAVLGGRIKLGWTRAGTLDCERVAELG